MEINQYEMVGTILLLYDDGRNLHVYGLSLILVKLNLFSKNILIIIKDMFNYDSSDTSTKDSDAAKSALLKYSWFYSIYSFPNMILPLLGGFFVDKIGVRVAAFIFALIIMVG
jgi:MFS family permease